MADISKMTLPNGTTYNIKDAVALHDSSKSTTYLEPIVTKTAGKVSTLYYPTCWSIDANLTISDGMLIQIKMPSAGHDYGVFLSVDNGDTYSPIGLGAQDTTRFGTNFPIGSTLLLQYSANQAVNSVYSYNGATGRSNITGCWKVVNGYRDGNGMNALREESGKIIVGDSGGSPYSIFALDKSGKYQMLVLKTNAGTGTNKTVNKNAKFAMNPIIRYYNANNSTNPNSTVSSTGSIYSALSTVDIRYSTNYQNNFESYTPTYIECTIDDNGYWSPTDNCIVQTFTNGFYYIFIGNSYSTKYYISLCADHPIYYYDGTKLIDYKINLTEELYVGCHTTKYARITDCADGYFRRIVLYGKSEQEGTPTPIDAKNIQHWNGELYSNDINHTKESHISTGIELYGIKVDSGWNYTDSNGNHWLCDVLDSVKGTIIRNVKIEKLASSLNWKKSSAHIGSYYVGSWCSSRGIEEGDTTSLVTHFVFSNRDGYSYGKAFATTSLNLFVGEELCPTLADFKNWLSNNDVYILYRLSEPIEEPLTNEQIIELNNLKTYSEGTCFDLASYTYPFHDMYYWKNTENGQAIADMDAKINKLFALLSPATTSEPAQLLYAPTE